MAQAFHDSGLRRMLNLKAENGAAVGQLQVGLFKSAVTFDPTDDAIAYTAVEADFNGYARQNVEPSGVAFTDSGQAVQAFASNVFQRSTGGSPNDIYGAFLIDGTTGDLVGVADDPAAPQTIDTDGQTYTVTFTFRDARA